MTDYFCSKKDIMTTSHHSHTHSHFGNIAEQSRFRLAVSLFLTLGFVVFEAIAGYKAHSLALLSDAGHNLTDVIALGLSWYALRLSSQPAHAGKTFGYHRVGILVALINSSTLILIAFGIFYEAYQRFIVPAPVDAHTLISVGSIAFVINAGTAWLIMQGSEHDLNLRSTFLHLMGDVFSTVGAVFAGIVMLYTGLIWLDPLVSVLIAVLILWSAWGILRETISILLESTPTDIDMSEIVRDLLSIKGVDGVHDLHAWSITQNLRMLSAHIVVNADMPLSEGAMIQWQINQLVSQHYSIYHTTLQLEYQGCEPDVLYCDLNKHSHTLHHHSHHDHKEGESCHNH
jgi:cobalt-zinc-cadmium efflux system protein